MPNSLTKNTVLTLVANISLAASNWLVLVIIAKQFNAEFLGMFVLALSLCSPSFLFASFKVRTLLVVDLTWRFKAEEYACSRLFGNLIISLLLLTGSALDLIELPMLTMGLVIFYKWCDSWSEFCQSYMRRFHKFKEASLSLTLRSFFTFTTVLIASSVSNSFETLLIAWCVIASMFSAVDTFFMYKLSVIADSRVFRFNLVMTKQSLSAAFRLYKEYLTVAFALAISSLFVYLPNLLLSYKVDMEAAGQFAAISYFLIAGGILVNSISQASTPKLASYLSTDNYLGFLKLVQRMCFVGLLIGLVGFFIAFSFGDFFLELFYTNEISQHFLVLNWVMAAAAVRYIYIFLGTSLASVQQFHIQTKIYASGLITMFIAGFILIEINGLAGAGQAMLLSTIVELLLFCSLSKKYWMIAFSKNRGRL